MKLTVLGNNGTCPARDGACSSFLVEADGRKILIDMGNGSVAKLQNVCGLSDIDIIIISHLHFDHLADLFPFKYALETRKHFGESIDRIRLFIPPVPQWIYNEISTNDVFDITYISDRYIETINDIQLEVFKVPHLIDSFAIRLSAGNKVFAYSSDCGVCDRLAEAAKSADLFLCESTFIHEEAGDVKHHMSALDAGEMAKRAGAKRLLLTHLSNPTREKLYLDEAKINFQKVSVSHILESYNIS